MNIKKMVITVAVSASSIMNAAPAAPNAVVIRDQQEGNSIHACYKTFAEAVQLHKEIVGSMSLLVHGSQTFYSQGYMQRSLNVSMSPEQHKKEKDTNTWILKLSSEYLTMATEKFKVEMEKAQYEQQQKQQNKDQLMLGNVRRSLDRLAR